jgi:hypothetical protein
MDWNRLPSTDGGIVIRVLRTFDTGGEFALPYFHQRSPVFLHRNQPCYSGLLKPGCRGSLHALVTFSTVTLSLGAGGATACTMTQSGFVFAQGVDSPTERRHMAEKALDGAPSGARDVVATFRCASAFWQPGLPCSLDNPLILLAEGRMVGKAESFLHQSLHGVPWSQLEELRNRRGGLGVLLASRIRGGEINVNEPERLPGRKRLEAPFEGLRVARQVRAGVAEDEIPDIQGAQRLSWKARPPSASPQKCLCIPLGAPRSSVASGAGLEPGVPRHKGTCTRTLEEVH